MDAKLPQIALKLVGASLSQQQKDETVQAFLRAAAGSLLNLIMDHRASLERLFHLSER